jgi:cell division transport system permease protein
MKAFDWKVQPAEARLLPEGRMAGPMPWVIAIMMVLAILAAAAGLSLGNAARQLDADLEGRVTIQVIAPQAPRRAAEVRAVEAELGKLAAVDSFQKIGEAEMAALLDPWFGADGIDPDMPIPALIDVRLKRSTPADLDTLRARVATVAPSARVDQHAQWLAPLASLIGSLRWLSLLLLMMMAGAAAAVVVLAARAALNTHRATIEVMHLLGASDAQIANLFQRRLALDAAFGCSIGFLVALIAMLLVGGRIGAIGSDLLGGAGLGWAGWLAILMLPLAGVAVATLAARFTVLAALRQML